MLLYSAKIQLVFISLRIISFANGASAMEKWSPRRKVRYETYVPHTAMNLLKGQIGLKGQIRAY